MESKKINQLATEMAPVASDLTIIGDPITGVSKKITLEQLAVLFGGAISFYSSYSSFPATGDVDIIYCAKDTNKLYLWNGAYVEIFPSQALLDTYQLRSEKGNANGYASLDSLGKVPVSQLPSSLMEYKGTWNASTNTPTLANGTGDTGDVYICSVAGTVNFGAGAITFAVGDYVIYSGTIWQRSSGATGTVTSVAVTESGDALTITGSPITTSGTINIGFAGSSAQYVAGDGSLVTFPSIITEAQKLVTEVYNSTGATLTKGTVVYINGGQGNLPTITKAIATGDSTSAQTYGVVQSDITNMNNGYVVAMGALTNLDTQAYSVGTQLYLSATTAGAWTSTKQYAPNHLVYVGIVVRSHPTQGVVEIRIQNGFEMDELHNVAAQSPSNGNILQYVSSTALWTSVAGTTTNIAEGTNLYFTDARARAALSATTPLSYNNTTGAFSISQATTSTSGFLSSTDWNTFNNKQNALTNPITGTGVSGRIPYFNGTTTQTSSANLTWDNTNSILGTTSILATTDVAAYNLTINGIDFGKIQNITGQSWGLAYASSGASNALGSSALVWNTTGNVIIINKLNVGNYNNTYNLDITGTARISGQLTLGSTITNGTYTYTLPGATGTLALSSDLSSYVPTSRTLTINGTTYDLSANRSWTISAGINGSGTTNYVPKFTSGTAIGNSLIFDDGTNVGIGTASPTFKLDVQGGSIVNGNGTIQTALTYATTGIVGTLSNHALSIYANNAERMRISSTGLVGIGTTSPTSPLHVGTATSGNQKIQHWGEPGFVNDYGLILRGSSLDGVFKFYGLNNGTETTAPILSMNRSSGNVGIGTAAPSSLLTIYKNANSDSAISIGNTVDANYVSYGKQGGTAYGATSAGDGFFYNFGNNLSLMADGSSGVIKFSAGGNTERMRITSGGNVLVGATAAAASVFQFQVGNGTADTRAYFNPSNAFAIGLSNSSGNVYYLGVGASGSAGSFQIYSNTTGSANLTITSTGAASFSGSLSAGTLYLGSLGTGTVYSSSGTLTNTNPSDKRLKDNITPITYGLKEVLQLNPVSFDWKNDNNKNKQFGFIAQEVQEVMPEAVIEGEYLGLEKDAIYTALVNAIKELKKEIDELKNK